MISCQLLEVDLDTKPQYEAISYSWGLDPEFSLSKLEVVEDTIHEERPILLNGKTHHVTMNLYRALTEFRRRKWDKMLWADQICINQQNNEDKALQLKLMTDIYSSASMVIIWLGKASMTKNNALDFMEKLADRPERAAADSLTSLNLDANDAQRPKLNKLSRSFNTLSQISSAAASHYHWLIVTFVLGTQWFKRAWTIQELFLSTKFKILMGSRDIEPESITRALSQMLDFYTFDPFAGKVGMNVLIVGVKSVLQHRAALFDEREKFLGGKRYSAEEYLAMTRARLASVPKDKVFAGAALLKGGALISVDYNCTTLEIYLAFATERLWPETRVFTLSLVGGTEPSTEGLPTWVPDLNSMLRPEPLQYCGGLTLKAPIYAEDDAFDIEGKQLHIKIAVCDRVKATGESIWSWTGYTDGPYNTLKMRKMRTSTSVVDERFGLMFSLLNDLGVSYAPTGERTIDAYWQTLIGGIVDKSNESIELWRSRFMNWFAFTLVEIRDEFSDQKKNLEDRHRAASRQKYWIIPLIADQPALEARVTKFLDFHDQVLDQVDEQENTSKLLRRTIRYIMKRVYGIEDFDQWSQRKDYNPEWVTAYKGEDHLYDPIAKFAEQFESTYSGRRLLTTAKGYLGISTESVKVGDVICHVAGATVPYVLRPVASKEGTFALVGEAYVHGAMDEGMVANGDLKFEKVTIV